MCSSSLLDPGPAERIAAWGRAAFEWGDSCGIEAMGGSFVVQDGKLTETLEWGFHEVSLLTIDHNFLQTVFDNIHFVATSDAVFGSFVIFVIWQG